MPIMIRKVTVSLQELRKTEDFLEDKRYGVELEAEIGEQDSATVAVQELTKIAQEKIDTFFDGPDYTPNDVQALKKMVKQYKRSYGDLL